MPDRRGSAEDPRDWDPFGQHGLQGVADDEVEGRLGPAVRLAVVVTVLATLAVTAAAGPAGLLVALSAATGVTALVLGLRLPAPPPRRRRRRPGPPVDNAPYGAFREVAEQLSWAAVSPRHYDLVTRPLLTRLASSRLSERHQVDLHADPDAARKLLGDDVWPWVDPGTAPSRDSQPPGVPRETLTRIVDRLERL